MNKKQIGKYWENLVVNYYESQWFEKIKKNYYIKWWEIDLIFFKNNTYYFIEVKVVDHIDSLDWYITKNKLKYIKKTILSFMLDNGITSTNKQQLDVVFIKNWEIYKHFENITF